MKVVMILSCCCILYPAAVHAGAPWFSNVARNPDLNPCCSVLSSQSPSGKNLINPTVLGLVPQKQNLGQGLLWQWCFEAVLGEGEWENKSREGEESPSWMWPWQGLTWIWPLDELWSMNSTTELVSSWGKGMVFQTIGQCVGQSLSPIFSEGRAAPFGWAPTESTMPTIFEQRSGKR